MMTAESLMKTFNAPCKGPIVDPYDLSRDFYEIASVGVIEGYAILPNGNLESSADDDTFLFQIPAYFASLWLEQGISNDFTGWGLYDWETERLLKWTFKKSNNNYICVAKNVALEAAKFGLHHIKGYGDFISKIQQKAVLPRELFTNINSFVYLMISTKRKYLFSLRYSSFPEVQPFFWTKPHVSVVSKSRTLKEREIIPGVVKRIIRLLVEERPGHKRILYLQKTIPVTYRLGKKGTIISKIEKDISVH